MGEREKNHELCEQCGSGIGFGGYRFEAEDYDADPQTERVFRVSLRCQGCKHENIRKVVLTRGGNVQQ